MMAEIVETCGQTWCYPYLQITGFN